MPLRKTPLVTDHFYHIFNRGVEKRITFTDTREYKHFLETMKYYQHKDLELKFSHATYEMKQTTSGKKLIDIIAYCLMPNHFHLLVKQLEENGISTFMRRSINSYTRYFNTKHERIGPLLQGPFKVALIENDEQFIHVSRYIHLNPLVGYITKDLRLYEWSSYTEYLGIHNSRFCNPSEILNFFKNPTDYERFVKDQEDYAKQLELAKHIHLDLEE